MTNVGFEKPNELKGGCIQYEAAPFLNIIEFISFQS